MSLKTEVRLDFAGERRPFNLSPIACIRRLQDACDAGPDGECRNGADMTGPDSDATRGRIMLSITVSISVVATLLYAPLMGMIPKDHDQKKEATFPTVDEYKAMSGARQPPRTRAHVADLAAACVLRACCERGRFAAPFRRH